MKLKYKILAILFIIVHFFSPSFSQQNIETLKNNFRKANNTHDKVLAADPLVKSLFSQNDKDSFLFYAIQVLPLYEQINELNSLNRLKMSISQTYVTKGDFDKADQYLFKDENYFLNIKDYKRQSTFDYIKGKILSVQKNVLQSQDYFLKIIDSYIQGHELEPSIVFYSFQTIFESYINTQQYSKALKIAGEYANFMDKFYPNDKGYVTYNIAILYRNTSDYKKANTEFHKCLDFYTAKNDLTKITACKVYLGINYSSLGQYDSAIIYLNNALQYYISTHNKEAEARIYNALSQVYFNEKNIDKAEYYILKSINLNQNEKENDINLYDNALLASINLVKNMKDSVLIRAGKQDKTALRLATDKMESNFSKILLKKENMSVDLLSHNYYYLYQANELLGNYEKAFHYYQSSIQLKDSFQSVNKLRDFTEMENSLAYEKQNQILKLEEANKRIQLQKEIELKALKYEYEKKQAVAKTQEEKQQLIHEEAIKRKEIELKFEQEQKQVALKFEQDKAIAKINQEKKDAVANAELKSAHNIRNLSALGVCLATLLLGIAIWSYWQKRKDNQKIAVEKRKSDELLLNILPHEIAEELKEKGSTSAQLHEEVTVIFTDFVNFTKNAEKIGVQELLNELNIYFTAFDEIMSKYNLEKIKTIGDAYLAVSGLPTSNPNHAHNAILAAKDIIQFVNQRKITNAQALDIRIGVHSGPIIAGIVGVKKFAYDIWGDTVNTAARIEQNSLPGKINISATTYKLVQSDYTFEHRGLIETKGKGALEMFFVV